MELKFKQTYGQMKSKQNTEQFNMIHIIQGRTQQKTTKVLLGFWWKTKNGKLPTFLQQILLRLVFTNVYHKGLLCIFPLLLLIQYFLNILFNENTHFHLIFLSSFLLLHITQRICVQCLTTELITPILLLGHTPTNFHDGTLLLKCILNRVDQNVQYCRNVIRKNDKTLSFPTHLFDTFHTGITGIFKKKINSEFFFSFAFKHQTDYS